MTSMHSKIVPAIVVRYFSRFLIPPDNLPTSLKANRTRGYRDVFTEQGNLPTATHVPPTTDRQYHLPHGPNTSPDPIPQSPIPCHCLEIYTTSLNTQRDLTYDLCRKITLSLLLFICVRNKMEY